MVDDLVVLVPGHFLFLAVGLTAFALAYSPALARPNILGFNLQMAVAGIWSSACYCCTNAVSEFYQCRTTSHIIKDCLLSYPC